VSGDAAPSRRRIFDFLKSRSAHIRCPLCGREDWNGWDERVLLERSTTAHDTPEPYEAIPLVCANCGFIRLQSAHVLDDPRGGGAEADEPLD
jgi:hypothetical protein